MRILEAPEALTAVVLVQYTGNDYALEVCYVNDGSAMPIERRTLSKALRELADAVDEQAEAVGD